MRLDHPNYIKLAIAAYHEKRLSNALSPLLMHSTPANIRRECATVYQERYDKKDEPMLRAFFGPGEQRRKFQALIENFDVDKFRPLNSFLREEGKKNITDKNLDLLAWLIDFKYRPYNFGMEVFLTEKERQILEIENPGTPSKEGEDELNPKQGTGNVGEFVENQEEDKDEVKDIPQKEDEQPLLGAIKDPGEIAAKDKSSSVKNTKWKKPVAIGLITAVLSGTMYLSGIVKPGHSNAGCMYWAGDHYEKVSCDTIIKDRPTLSFDKSLENLRLITQTDTISEWSIGKVHYIKDSGVKFYTGAGLYPEDPTRPLKKLTRYMFDKYLRSKKDTGKYASAEINRSN